MLNYGRSKTAHATLAGRARGVLASPTRRIVRQLSLALWRIDDDAFAHDLAANQTKFELVVAVHRLARRRRQQLHAAWMFSGATPAP